MQAWPVDKDTNNNSSRLSPEAPRPKGVTKGQTVSDSAYHLLPARAHQLSQKRDSQRATVTIKPQVQCVPHKSQQSFKNWMGQPCNQEGTRRAKEPKLARTQALWC